MEFALTELWERQVGGMLTHAAYEETGRLSGAIAKRAETLFRSLSQSEQDAARRILTRLVRLAEDRGEDSRQRASLSSLCAHAEPDFDAGRKVLDLLTVARLITVGSGDDARQREVAEIAHEALIRSWPRFGQWLQEDREVLVWRQRTRTLINHWQAAARDNGLLLRGALLDEAKLWLARRPKELWASEREFIDASVTLDKKERANRPAATVIPPSSVFDVKNAAVKTLPKPTTTNTYQVGSVFKTNRVTLNADFYHSHFQNAYTSYTDPISTEVVYTLPGDSSTTGVEAEGNVFIGHGLSAYLNGTAGKAKYVTRGAGCAAAKFA
jgi:hypothetical protein